MADGGSRNVTIIAGLYTLIQGLLWSLISIYCIAVYDCILDNPLIQLSGDTNNVNTYTLLYASYFNGSSCSGGPAFNGTFQPSQSSLRTYYWMIGYAIVSAIWIPVSVLLVVSGVYKVKGVCGTYLYIPWIFLSIIITVADLVAVIFYSIDISKTMSTGEYVKFLGASGTWQEVTGVEDTGIDSAAPAVIMTLFFSRFVVFWLLNLSLIFHCIKESRDIRKFHLQSSVSTEDIMDDERFRTWSRPNLNRPLNFNTDKKDNDNLSSHLKLNRNRKSGVTEVNINEERNIVHENISSDAHLEESKTNPKIMYKVDEFGIPIEEIRIPRAANSYTDSQSSGTPVSSPVFDYLGRPALSQLSRRRAERTNGTDQSKLRNLSSQELRGQAPWSYLHPTRPTQISPPVSPPIPVPDYLESPTKNQQFSYTHSRPSLTKKQSSSRRVHGLQ